MKFYMVKKNKFLACISMEAFELECIEDRNLIKSL